MSAAKPSKLVNSTKQRSSERWQFVAKANWQKLQGEGSTIIDKLNHPVVHIAYEDTLAYAQWGWLVAADRGQREFAAGGG